MDFSFAAVHDETNPFAGIKCLLGDEAKSFDLMNASAAENAKSFAGAFASVDDRDSANDFAK
ncbi:MAG: hypothetical protein LBV12_08040 [Puniceicoccales bacterium]|nr:hypothetical protein [Puniceicoccales bacterium]